MKKSFLLLAASYFVHYPKENTIFFTKDEQAFFSENDATNHGKSLRAKESDEVELVKVTREEAEAAKAEEPAAEATATTEVETETTEVKISGEKVKETSLKKKK